MNTKIIEGLSTETFIEQIGKKNKLHQAIALQALEDSFANELLEWKTTNKVTDVNQIHLHVEENKKKYKELRKILLDWSNEYTRSIIRIVFGDSFEGNLK